MKRIFVVLCVGFLAACASAPPAKFAFPPAIGSWTLVTARETAASDAPESIRRLGIKRVQLGEYQGPGKMTAQVYEMTSSSAAFEAEQTWKASADRVAFHKESWFAVIHWESPDRNAVSVFVRQMEKLLGP